MVADYRIIDWLVKKTDVILKLLKHNFKITSVFLINIGHYNQITCKLLNKIIKML